MSPKTVTFKISSTFLAFLALSSFARADMDEGRRDERRDEQRDKRELRRDERREQEPKLSFLLEPSSHGVASESLSTSPWLYTVSRRGFPDFRPLRDLAIAAYLDPACTVPASKGELSAGLYPFYSEFGLALFHDVRETATGGIYLKISARNRVAACSSLISIGAGAADHLIGLQGSGQSGTQSSVLVTPAKVQVVDAHGNPVSGVNISFTSSSGGGSASPASSTSDSTGTVSSSLKLGSAVGSDVFVAGRASIKLPGTPATITFTETATAAGGPTVTPTSLALSGPASQQAGACAAFTVAALGKTGATAKETTALAVTLSGLGSGTLYSDAACGTALASLNIAAGQSQTVFYLKDNKVEVLSLSASGGNLTASSAISDSILAGAASVLGFSAQPSVAAIAGQALAIQPSLKVLDAFGNAVSAGSYSVTLGSFSDAACTTAVTGTLSATANPVSTASSTATFAGVGFTQSATVYLGAASSGLTSACSKAIAVGAAAPSKINIIAGNNESAAVDSRLSVSPQVKVTDVFGNAVSGAGLVFAITGGGGSVTPATATSDANGLASAALTLGNAPGTDSLLVSATAAGVAWAPSVSGVASASFTETAAAGAPSSLALSGPSALQAGACSSAFTVSLSDAQGNPAQAASGLSIALSGQGHGSFYSDAACTTALGSLGVAAGASSQTYYFADTTAEGLTIVADGSASGLGTSSLAASVAPGAASKLAFSAQPTGATPAGAAFAIQPAVSALDSFGNLATSALGDVALAAYSDAACTSLAGGSFQITSSTLALRGGQAVFTGANYTLAGVLYLGASSEGLSSTCSAAFAISAAAADHLIALAGNGQAATVGQALAVSPQVKVVDGYGNSVSGTSISFAAASGSASPAQATSDSSGLTSTTWTLGTAPGSVTLNAQGVGLAGSPSQVSFTATASAGAPAVFILSGPSSQGAGACSSAFAISAQDRFGNPAPASSALSIALGGAGSGSFYSDASCTQASSSATVAAGSATASFYFKDMHAENLLLTASLGSAGSTLPFSILPGAASQLVFTLQPSGTGVAGQALSTQPGLAVRDSNGNTVTSATNSVQLAAFSDAACTTPASGVLAASSNPLQATSGVAAFSGISDTLAGQIYLSASSSGLSGACSGAIQISAAAASKILAVQGDAQSATAGTTLAINPTVQVTDAFGNVASGATVSFTVSAGGGSLSAASAVTDGSGHASTQFTLGSTAGANSLTASLGLGALGASVSFGETGTQLAPTALILSGPTSLTAGACSAAFTIQLMSGAQTPTVAQAATTIGLSGAGNGSFYTDSGCATSATSIAIAQGTGSAVVYVLDRSAEALTLAAQSGTLTPSNLSAAVSAAAAANLVFTAQPSAVATAGTVLATQPTVSAVDAFGNTTTGFAASVTLGAFSDSACTLAATGGLSAASNPVSASAGIAGFSGVSYSAPGIIYLQAASSGVTSACSQAVVSAVAMSLSAGTAHTCALSNGNVKCWGFNNAGNLGDGNNTNAATPQQVVGLTSGVLAMGTGGQHGCASTSSGLSCWGLNFSGQLGNGTTTNSNVPVMVAGIGGGVSQIVGGDSHTCVLINGAVQCWGDNTYGQLGNGSNVSSAVPVLVQGLPALVQSIAAASETTCAVLTTGSAYCWGYNDFGQLGNGTFQDSNLPVQVQGLTAVTSIAPGIENTCALVGGSVYCWGQNNSGQLGNGSFSDSLTPVQITSLGSNVTKLLSGGENFSCAILATGAVQCWGQNSRGQLGDAKASGSQSNVPVQVVGLTSGYQILHAGYVHACASDGTHIKCWGFGSSGQLGNGVMAASNVPVQVIGY